MRWLTVTDPLGGVERYEFASGAPGIPFSVDSSEIPNMPSLFNSYINYRSTFYWDKTTMAAINQGKTLLETAPKAPVTRALRELARALGPAAEAKEGKGLFGLRLLGGRKS